MIDGIASNRPTANSVENSVMLITPRANKIATIPEMTMRYKI